MQMGSKGQVAMSMGCAIGTVALLVISVIVGAAIMGRTADEVSHPVEKEVAMCATSVGFPLLALLVIVLICVVILFCISSMRAFGG